MGVKISIIGAGSAIFSLNIIRDICLTPKLAGSTLCLMDVNQQRLDNIFLLCKRYSEEIGFQLDLRSTTSTEEALLDSDYVINTALVGGWSMIEPGWKIGLDLGYRFGGSLHIMHDEAFWINFGQFQQFDKLAQSILRICPNAYLFLISNPVFAGTTYLSREYPELNLVGLCHGFSGVFNLIEGLGLDKTKVSYEIPGVNHFVWLTKFQYNGKDAYPLIDQWLQNHDITQPDTPWQLKPKRVDLYRRLGILPIGDTGSEGGGDWPWWHHIDSSTEDEFDEYPQTWFHNYIYDGYANVEKIQKTALDKSMKVSEVYPPQLSGEQIVPIIESITCDIQRIFTVNMLNFKGAFVPGVPENLAVEIPALVNSRGIQGIQTSPLPKTVLSYLLRDYAAPIELEISAYMHGRRSDLLELIMQDPWTRSRKQAERLLESILALPFNKDMSEHYR